MKWTDQTYCSPFQSSYLRVMKDRFLPPPIPVVYNSQAGGIQWAKDDKEATYPCFKLSHYFHPLSKGIALCHGFSRARMAQDG